MHKVTFKPHIGVQRSIFGPIEVEHDQYMIFINGMHVGYVGKAAGSPINIFAEVPKSVIADIRQAVAEQHGIIGPVAIPPTAAEVAEHFRAVENERDDE